MTPQVGGGVAMAAVPPPSGLQLKQTLELIREDKMRKCKEMCRGCHDDFYNQNRDEGRCKFYSERD